MSASSSSSSTTPSVGERNSQDGKGSTKSVPITSPKLSSAANSTAGSAENVQEIAVEETMDEHEREYFQMQEEEIEEEKLGRSTATLSRVPRGGPYLHSILQAKREEKLLAKIPELEDLPNDFKEYINFMRNLKVAVEELPYKNPMDIVREKLSDEAYIVCTGLWYDQGGTGDFQYQDFLNIMSRMKPRVTALEYLKSELWKHATSELGARSKYRRFIAAWTVYEIACKEWNEELKSKDDHLLIPYIDSFPQDIRIKLIGLHKNGERNLVRIMEYAERRESILKEMQRDTFGSLSQATIVLMIPSGYPRPRI